MDDLMSRHSPPTLEEYVESFAVGFLDPLVGESWGRLFLGFVSREMISPRLPGGVFVDEFIDPLMQRSLAALARVCPEVDESSARLCLMSMVGQLLHALKAHHLFGGQDRKDLVPEILSDYITHFVRFSVGGIRACAVFDDHPQEVLA
jgi:hypothetical protein